MRNVTLPIRGQARAFVPLALWGTGRETALVVGAASALGGVLAWIALLAQGPRPGGPQPMSDTTCATLLILFALAFQLLTAQAARRCETLYEQFRRLAPTRRPPAVAFALHAGFVILVGALLMVPGLAVALSGTFGMSAPVALAASGALACAGGALACLANATPVRDPWRSLILLAICLAGVWATTLFEAGAPLPAPVAVLLAACVLAASALAWGCVVAARPRDAVRAGHARWSWSYRGATSSLSLELMRDAVRPGPVRSVVVQCVGLCLAACVVVRMAPRDVVSDALPFVAVLLPVVWSHVTLSSWLRYAEFPHFRMYSPGAGARSEATMQALPSLLLAVPVLAVFWWTASSRAGVLYPIPLGCGVLLVSVAAANCVGAYPALLARVEGSESYVLGAIFVGAFIFVRGVIAVFGATLVPFVPLGVILLLGSVGLVWARRAAAEDRQPRRQLHARGVVP